MSRRITATDDLEARFAVLGLYQRLGLYSEAVEHALFAEIGWPCWCSRCRWWAAR
ncbi:MAG TPA: hypothetical protein VGX23_33780 [Actinocrinis sp.]|nr:hypothetical protein [Actinocrinis sp.]